MVRFTEKVKDYKDYIKLPTIDKQAFLNRMGYLEDLIDELLELKEANYRGYLTDEQLVDILKHKLTDYVNYINEGD